MPSNTIAGPLVTLRGVELPTLVDESGGPPRFFTTMPVTFEDLQARLAELPRCDLEPDGYFLTTGGHGETLWQLNGHLHEYASPGCEPQMHRVELRGECPGETLNLVLSTTGWPEVELAFELVHEGVSLSHTSFRKWAGAI